LTISSDALYSIKDSIKHGKTMTNTTVKKEDAIKALVKNSVETFANSFRDRHQIEVDNPNGTINMKIHNVFISILGEEIQYYTALVRSFDSSLGNMLEKLAMNIASLSFQVKRSVEGTLSIEQTRKIAEILESYKRRERKPKVEDYQCLRTKHTTGLRSKRHDSDYYLIDKKTGVHSLIELKIGGDLDNKKARSEKEAILEQYAILSNTQKPDTTIQIYFATAYNRFGEGKQWKQERVRQFFSQEELLIGKDFWNFVCKSDEGYDIVLETYKKHAPLIKQALFSIKKTYLG